MKPSSTIAVLKLLGSKVPLSQSRGGWIECSCPLGPWEHTNGKSSPRVFGARNTGRDPLCKCFSCAFVGDLSDLAAEIMMRNAHQRASAIDFKKVFELLAEADQESELVNLDSPGIEELLESSADGIKPFPAWWLGSFPPYTEFGWAKDYLAARGVHPKIASMLDLRADPNEKRVCFPVHDFEKQFAGLHGRAVNKATEPRYRMYSWQHSNNPIVWLGEGWIDFNKPILVVEGPMDLASCMRVYRNTTTPLFANPSAKKLARMADALQWVTLLDHGTGGNKGRENISKYMKETEIIHLVPPANRNDPGACSAAEIIDVLKDTLDLDETID